MKKVSLLVLCAVALGAFQPGIMAVPSKANVTNRLKNEYSQFKASMKCFKQKGWKGCTPAQRKRIAVAGVALTALIVVAVGGGIALLGPRMRKKSVDQEVKQIKKRFNKYPSKLNYNPFGKTPLQQAAFEGKVEVAKALIDIGAEIDLTDPSDGRTPLSYAVQGGHQDVVKLLLERGAEMNLKDSYGNTPLGYAVQGGHQGVVKLLFEYAAKWTNDLLGNAIKGDHREIISILLDNGVEIDAKDGWGKASLHIAADSGNIEAGKLLLERGAGVDITDRFYNTPLHAAARKGYKNFVEFLIGVGAGIEKMNYNGETPLRVAVSNGHKEVVGFLIEKGATVFEKDIIEAKRNGDKEIISLLQKEFAKR